MLLSELFLLGTSCTGCIFNWVCSVLAWTALYILWCRDIALLFCRRRKKIQRLRKKLFQVNMCNLCHSSQCKWITANVWTVWTKLKMICFYTEFVKERVGIDTHSVNWHCKRTKNDFPKTLQETTGNDLVVVSSWKKKHILQLCRE